jgi:hypothetical protein
MEKCRDLWGKFRSRFSRGYSLPCGKTPNRRLPDPFCFEDANSVAHRTDLRAPYELKSRLKSIDQALKQD